MSAEEILSQMCGMDKNKQIIDLWFEVIYQRNIIEAITKNVPCLFDRHGLDGVRRSLDKEREAILQDCVEKAKQEVLKKFPNMGVTFQSN
jgi:hypothetical protein